MGMGILAVGCCNCGGASTGGTVGTIPNCLCDPIPAILSMYSGSPTCNAGMYQSCTIEYQMPPDWAVSLDLGEWAYLSNESFPDAIGGGALFYYLLTCYGNQFRLSRIYQTSPYGSPYRDGLLYSWAIGPDGNTCTPFALTNGASFEGSDETCYVSITS